MEVIENSSHPICGYTEECPFIRFIYITVAGFVSIFGVLANALLFFIFVKRQTSNCRSNFYPAVLAVLDMLLCIAYLLLFVVDVNMVYLENKELFSAYHSYILIVLTFSKMNQLAIPYLLIWATCERLLWIGQNNESPMRSNIICGPHLRVLMTILLCILIRFPSFFLLIVEEFWDCPDPMRTLAVAPTSLASESFWFFYDTYFIVILQTVIPFIVLLSLNIIIVQRVIQNGFEKQKHIFIEKKVERTNSSNILSTLKFTKMSSSLQNAVYTMMAIVCTYLISNGLHIFLLLLEKTHASILYVNGDHYSASTFYTALSDSVSILYMISSAIRIVIYSVCNPLIRQQLTQIFHRSNQKDKSLIRSEEGFRSLSLNEII